MSAAPGPGADTRQLAVLKEFANIAHALSNEDFLSTMPQSKLKRVKWVPMFKCLQEQVVQGILQDWNGMWEEERMSDKLEVVEKQKEKFADRTEPMWRPSLGDVKAQLKAYDIAILQKQKHFLELQAKEYESKVAKLQKTLPAKRGFLRALQLDIQKCHKKNVDLNSQLEECFEQRKQLLGVICTVDKDVDISTSPLKSRNRDPDFEYN